jgi:hypothetical protein
VKANCPPGVLVPNLADSEKAMFKLSPDYGKYPGGPGCICDKTLATVACLINCVGITAKLLELALTGADDVCEGLGCCELFHDDC